MGSSSPKKRSACDFLVCHRSFDQQPDWTAAGLARRVIVNLMHYHFAIGESLVAPVDSSSSSLIMTDSKPGILIPIKPDAETSAITYISRMRVLY
jgi:hypothetical protein